MTTIHAPAGQNAVSHFAHIRFHRARSASLAIAIAVSLGLAGCESGNGLFAGNSPEATLAPQAAAPPPQPATIAKVAVAPVIGAPDAIARQLQQEFGAAVTQHRVSVVNTTDKSDYTLRGYIVSAKDRAGTKVSYIWDVTDPSGKRVNRITGEEILPAVTGKDPWTAVTPQVMQTIAQKSAQSFGAWIPTAAAQAPVAAAPGAPATAQGVGAPGPAPAVAPVSTASTGVTTARPTNASVSSSSLVTVVPSVVGAPGDGATSLTQAIQSELSRNGMSVTGQASTSGYRVEGVVRVGQANGGKQPIQIDWNVKDPQGKRLGTVSQKNEIPEGSLDGAWGKTADAAAAAAAQGIIKLLPQQSASN